MPKTTQNQSNHLWVPFFIVSVGFLASMIFVIWTLTNYQKPAPLLIKPSSLDSTQEISESLAKALFPYRKVYSLEVSGENNDFLYQDLKQKLESQFLKENQQSLSLQVKHISLKQKAQPQKLDCLNTALFNLNRKKERKWKNKIYFCVCVQKKDDLILYYTSN